MDPSAFVDNLPAVATIESMGFYAPSEMRNFSEGLEPLNLDLPYVSQDPYDDFVGGFKRGGYNNRNDFEGDIVRTYQPVEYEDRLEPIPVGAEESAAASYALEALFRTSGEKDTIKSQRDALNKAISESGTRKSEPRLSNVSVHVDDNVETIMGALSMAALGGPVGAVINLKGANACLAVHSRGDGRFTLVDPHPDPRATGFPPLGGFSAVFEQDHTPWSIAEYITTHYPSLGIDAVIHVPALEDDEVNKLKVQEMVIEKRAPPSVIPDGAVVFEEAEEGDGAKKRRHPQPTLGSPMRIESEESEEKRARTPPATTAAIPTTTPIADKVISEKPKSATSATSVRRKSTVPSSSSKTTAAPPGSSVTESKK